MKEVYVHFRALVDLVIVSAFSCLGNLLTKLDEEGGKG